MTLVAQGAAIYAATSGLDARPVAAKPVASHRLWMQYPPMSSDLSPHVVGRYVLANPDDRSAAIRSPKSVRLIRADAQFESDVAILDGEGAFVVSVLLEPRRSNVFRIEARDDRGELVAIEPATITIVQGLTVSDPPLSRTVGVALASDRVRVYVERGTPLPARRTFVHETVETVARGAADCLLRIPIVQGEYESAHLCRLVGSLEIGGAAVRASLPVGSKIEVTIEIDRGGRLSARALVPALDQVFEQVAHLVVPEATPETLEASGFTLRDRLARVHTDAFRRGDARQVSALGELERLLQQAMSDTQACRGGDADAGQKARRALLEVDAALDRADDDRRWPELEDDAREKLSIATEWVSELGTKEEQRLLSDTMRAVEKARSGKDVRELQRQLRTVSNLTNAAYYRDPDAWSREFEFAASRVATATDLPRAQTLVKKGRAALAKEDKSALREIVHGLWKILPADEETRRRGFESGVR